MLGRAVILTTHSMEECEALCSRCLDLWNDQNFFFQKRRAFEVCVVFCWAANGVTFGVVLMNKMLHKSTDMAFPVSNMKNFIVILTRAEACFEISEFLFLPCAHRFFRRDWKLSEQQSPCFFSWFCHPLIEVENRYLWDRFPCLGQIMGGRDGDIMCLMLLI